MVSQLRRGGLINAGCVSVYSLGASGGTCTRAHARRSCETCGAQQVRFHRFGSGAGSPCGAILRSAPAQFDQSLLTTPTREGVLMPTITTRDGVDIFYKDWGSGQPIVFSHGWPLSSDDWDNQLLFFGQHGYRVVAHDRRGHGRSSQVGDGHDMDHYADDLAAVVEHLDLRDVVHIGHSTGGGEVVHYLARHGESRAVKAALISAVPPLMVKTDANPEGLPKDVFDDLQAQLAAKPLGVLPRVALGSVLRIQPPGRRIVGGDHRKL